MTKTEEMSVIQKVLCGDRNAYEALVLANQQKVYSIALSLVGNWNDAQDISQEAFIKAYLKLRDYRGEGCFTAWLCRITHNLSIDYFRKKHRSRMTSLTNGEDDDGDDGIKEKEIPDIRSLPEDVVLKNEEQLIFAAYIDELKPKHREIFIMKEIAGMSYYEIAISLHLNEGTVKSRLSRARMNLKAILSNGRTVAEFVHLHS